MLLNYSYLLKSVILQEYTTQVAVNNGITITTLRSQYINCHLTIIYCKNDTVTVKAMQLVASK